MTTRGDLRDLTAAILKGATAAGPRVFTPGDWPTWDGEYPVIRVSAPREEKESQGRGGSSLFTVVATIQVILTVSAAADAIAWGQMEAEAAVDPVEAQILSLVIGNPALRRLTSQFPTVSSQLMMSPEGLDNLAELKLEIGMEFVQGPEQFWNPGAVDLTQVVVDMQPDGPALTWPQKKTAIVALADLGPASPGAPEIGLFLDVPQD